MPRQDHPAGFRADFARLLSDFMRDHQATTIELSRHCGVHRETIAEAAENRRAVRPETMEKIRHAMEQVRVRRQSATDPSASSARDAMVVVRGSPDHARISAALRAGTVVLVEGPSVEVWRCERVK